ncbi:DUF3408 domain-containing protein [Bacteroides fragilis]|uniref:DUF3408 domain-containing protein n=1 Tax=Bacteroides fragilis TaxID=817 RepID=UPI00321913F9
MKIKNKLFSSLSAQSKETEGQPSNYRARFLKEPAIRAKEGKLVYVSQKHHECIKYIARIIGNNEVSIYGIIDNIIAEHLEHYRAEIGELHKEYNNPLSNL